MAPVARNKHIFLVLKHFSNRPFLSYYQMLNTPMSEQKRQYFCMAYVVPSVEIGTVLTCTKFEGPSEWPI